MSSSPRIELLLFLAAVACNDSKVHPRPNPDTGLVDTDSGQDSDSEGCGPGILSEEDGRALRLSATVDDETDFHEVASVFGMTVLPERAREPAKVWVTTSTAWYADTRPNYDGAYLLDSSSWDGDGVLGPEARPTLYAEDGVHAIMVATGLTSGILAPMGGFAVATPSNRGDEYEGSFIWLAESAPTRPTDLLDWADAELHVESPEGQRSIFADLNGDGLDDVLVPGYATRIFLSPLSGSVVDADAYVEFPRYLSDGVAPFWPEDGAAADLDGDGYLDLVWKQAIGERDNHTQFDLFFKLGPIARAWDAPDARIVDEVSTLPEPSMAFSTVRAVGDITGDGRPDVTASFWYDAGGRDGSGSIIVLDAWPAGTTLLEDVPTRLVGIPGEFAGDPTSGLGSGGSGDVNGDGFDDLVVFQDRTDLYDGDQHRAYVAPGPLSGLVLLEEAAVQVRLPWLSGAPRRATAATVVPDLDGDGLDDVIVNVIDGGDLPGAVWLFAGCEQW